MGRYSQYTLTNVLILKQILQFQISEFFIIFNTKKLNFRFGMRRVSHQEFLEQSCVCCRGPWRITVLGPFYFFYLFFIINNIWTNKTNCWLFNHSHGSRHQTSEMQQSWRYRWRISSWAVSRGRGSDKQFLRRIGMEIHGKRYLGSQWFYGQYTGRVQW